MPSFARIAAGEMDRGAYAELLQFLQRYHGAMAGACAAGAARLNLPALAAAHRARLEALRADLSVFGRQPVAVLASVPNAGDFAVGCLYTVLGSTLGGKLIHRQLEGLLPDGQGRTFFKGGTEDGANWQRFCRRLEDVPLNLEQAEAGACHAFAAFKTMLAESEPAAACA